MYFRMGRVAALILAIVPPLAAAPPEVEFELVISPQAPLGAAQEWARTLGRLDVRVRSANNDRLTPKVVRQENRLQITAVVGGGSELIVPGGEFSMNQMGPIRAWIKRQQAGESELNSHARFGLGSEQLKLVHERLKSPVETPTKGQFSDRVINTLADRAGVSLEIPEVLRSRLMKVPVEAELQGLSSGTAMAVALRSSELGFTPSVVGERIRLSVGESDERGAAQWPVGWELPKKERDSVPKLFESLEIEINETPIAEVLVAIEGRLQTPVLYDTPMLQLRGIDPQTTAISVPAGKMLYRRLLSRSLFAARLDFELRVDDAGKPFLWITPLKK